MTLIETVRSAWDRWQSRRLRSRVTFLANRVATLEGALKAERELRDFQVVLGLAFFGAERLAWHQHMDESVRQATEHHAWLAALVEMQESNSGRYRTLLRRYRERVAVLQATPSTATVAEDVPAAEPEPTADATAVVAEGA